MKSRLLIAASLILPQVASAGPFTDELSRCLVKQTSDADKELLIQWIYVGMSKHPVVEQWSRLEDANAKAVSERAADLFVTLVAERCRDEASDAMRYDGQGAFEASFGVLGQVAMQGIMSHEAVGAYLGELENHIDSERLKQAFEESP